MGEKIRRQKVAWWRRFEKRLFIAILWAVSALLGSHLLVAIQSGRISL